MASSTAPGDHQIDWGSQANGGRDLATQLVISVTLGLSAFFSFCVCYPLARAICQLTNRCDSFSDRNGQSCTPREGKDEMQPPSYPNYRIASLVGYP